MKNLMFMGLGLMVGLILADMECMKMPKQEMKKALKKINIE